MLCYSMFYMHLFAGVVMLFKEFYEKEKKNRELAAENERMKWLISQRVNSSPLHETNGALPMPEQQKTEVVDAEYEEVKDDPVDEPSKPDMPWFIAYEIAGNEELSGMLSSVLKDKVQRQVRARKYTWRHVKRYLEYKAVFVGKPSVHEYALFLTKQVGCTQSPETIRKHCGEAYSDNDYHKDKELYKNNPKEWSVENQRNLFLVSDLSSFIKRFESVKSSSQDED